MHSVRIEESWKKLLSIEFEQPYFLTLSECIRNEYLTKTIFPKPADIFAAFRETPWDAVRVVILGQDPYHGRVTREVKNETGEVRLERVPQAMGLAFSVRDGVPPPPSLLNIFKEIAHEKAVDSSQYSVYRERAGIRNVRQMLYSNTSTDLTRWARQGVLLLNSVLTVEADKAGSHAALGREKNAAGVVAGGWEQFTDAVIQKISNEKEGIVFLLWGNYARSKKKLIDTNKHLVLEAPHPSPLSAHNGFFGCGHFTKANEYIHARGGRVIEW